MGKLHPFDWGSAQFAIWVCDTHLEMRMYTYLTKFMETAILHFYLIFYIFFRAFSIKKILFKFVFNFYFLYSSISLALPVWSRPCPLFLFLFSFRPFDNLPSFFSNSFIHFYIFICFFPFSSYLLPFFLFHRVLSLLIIYILSIANIFLFIFHWLNPNDNATITNSFEK